MSTLLTGLSVLGGVVLIGVIGYNEWQQRKTGLRTAPGELDKRIEPDAASLQTENLSNLPSLDLPLPHAAGVFLHGLDPLIDCVVSLELPHLHYGEALLAALPPTRRVGSKPLMVEGLSAETGLWEYPQPGRQYSQVQMGVQLANRMGALNEIEFSEFGVKTQAYADLIGAELALPDMREEVARARELDEFAKQVDGQLEFYIVARSAAWSAAYVQQHAQRLGFIPGMYPGRMVYGRSAMAEGQGDSVNAATGAATNAAPTTSPLVVLNFNAQAALAEELSESALREVALVLDIPHVPSASQPYAALRDLAIKLAANMDGVIVNADQQPISAAAMDAIAGQLQDIYDALDARDLSAGSALAQRLFS